jgi:transposase
MPAAVKLREDYSAEALRGLARRSKDANQSRRLLSLAAVLEGMERGEAARIGGMDRQTLRDWVHRFNERGPEGLLDHWTSGPKSRLSLDQLAQLAGIVEIGPEVKTDGVVRWRRVDLKRVISSRFGVDYHERSVGKLLRKLGFSHMSARPRHPKQDERIVESFKKTSPRPHVRMRRASVRRTASCANGRGAEHGRASRLTSVMRAPICSAPFVRRAERARRWRCPAPTPMRCNGISRRSRPASRSAPMPCCSSIAPAGTPRPTWSCPRTSRQSGFPRARPSSIRWKTSGSICGRTGSPTASSRPSTTSSMRSATPGTNSPPSPKRSHQSGCANGPTSVIAHDRWY